MKIWIVTTESESCDRYSKVFNHKPTEKELDDLAINCDSDEELDGPGRAGSYVYILDVLEQDIDTN